MRTSRTLFGSPWQSRGGLAELAAATEDRLAAAGIAPEDRRYTPHVTLARLGRREGSPPVNTVALRRDLATHEPPAFVPFEAREFYLYASAGGRYTKLAAFPSAPGATAR
ncbi:MAG: hypothetical protein FJW31_23800 [Acidobacteria bacterium]|nr:hypothetical protein [Acidobacteriota bacterium]